MTLSSAPPCVPTCAPFEANVALLIAGTQRGFFAARPGRLLMV